MYLFLYWRSRIHLVYMCSSLLLWLFKYKVKDEDPCKLTCGSEKTKEVQKWETRKLWSVFRVTECGLTLKTYEFRTCNFRFYWCRVRWEVTHDTHTNSNANKMSQCLLRWEQITWQAIKPCASCWSSQGNFSLLFFSLLLLKLHFRLRCYSRCICYSSGGQSKYKSYFVTLYECWQEMEREKKGRKKSYQLETSKLQLGERREKSPSESLSKSKVSIISLLFYSPASVFR